MKQRQRRLGMGRVFKRKSRATGRELPTYWIAYYIRGQNGRPQERRESAHTTDYEVAKQLLRKRQGEIAEDKIQPINVERVTVGDLLDLYVQDHEDKGPAVPLGHVDALKQAFGHMRNRDLKRYHLENLVHRFKRDGARPGRPGNGPASLATCNRYMATLRRAYTLGREQLGLDVTLTFPHERETNRGKYISPADFYAILKHIRSEVKRDMCEFAYRTGVRKGQLRLTEKSNVDPHRWVLSWRSDQVKSREPHVLPLVGRELEIIQRRWAERRLDCTYLFHENGKRLGLLRSEWNRACRAAGFPVGRKNGGYVFHNTRHSAVSNLNGAGVPDSVAMTISGHQTPSVFRRYSIRQESVQRAALEKVADYLRGLTVEPTVTPMEPKATYTDTLHGHTTLKKATPQG